MPAIVASAAHTDQLRAVVRIDHHKRAHRDSHRDEEHRTSCACDLLRGPDSSTGAYNRHLLGSGGSDSRVDCTEQEQAAHHHIRDEAVAYPSVRVRNRHEEQVRMPAVRDRDDVEDTTERDLHRN